MALVLVIYFMYDNFLAFGPYFLFSEIFGIYLKTQLQIQSYYTRKNHRHEAYLRKKSTFLGTHQNILDKRNQFAINTNNQICINNHRYALLCIKKCTFFYDS